jgi:hypothetical protein
MTLCGSCFRSQGKERRLAMMLGLLAERQTHRRVIPPQPVKGGWCQVCGYKALLNPGEWSTEALEMQIRTLGG